MKAYFGKPSSRALNLGTFANHHHYIVQNNFNSYLFSIFLLDSICIIFVAWRERERERERVKRIIENKTFLKAINFKVKQTVAR